MKTHTKFQNLISFGALLCHKTNHTFTFTFNFTFWIRSWLMIISKVFFKSKNKIDCNTETVFEMNLNMALIVDIFGRNPS